MRDFAFVGERNIKRAFALLGARVLRSGHLAPHPAGCAIKKTKRAAKTIDLAVDWAHPGIARKAG